MDYNDVRIDDSEELKRVAEILKSNIGTVLCIKGFNRFSDTIRERDYYELYSIVGQVLYDSEGMPFSMYAKHFVPTTSVSRPVGYVDEYNPIDLIVGIETMNGESLYERSINIEHKSTK